MRERRGRWAAAMALAGAVGHSQGETRISVAIAASDHGAAQQRYESTHVGVGATGEGAGEWLRWRAGVTRHSEGRVGPYAGVAVTGTLGRGWRAGVSAGAIGNYARRRWVRVGVVPIAQWRQGEGGLVWEVAVARAAGVTFAGVNVQVPLGRH